MSFKRLVSLLHDFGSIIAAVTYVLGTEIIPTGSVTRLEFERIYKNKRSSDYARNIQLEVDSGTVAYMERYEGYNKTGYRFSLDKFENHQLVSHLTARRITYDTTGVHRWIIKDYMIREMKGMREIITKGERIDSTINMEPQDFLRKRGQQETMTSRQLREYIDEQKKRGFANIKVFEVEYYRRIAMSFAAFILTVIGLSLSSQSAKEKWDSTWVSESDSVFHTSFSRPSHLPLPSMGICTRILLYGYPISSI